MTGRFLGQTREICATRAVNKDAHGVLGLLSESTKTPDCGMNRTTVRATTLVNKLLDLPGLAVSGVSLEPGRLLVDVELTARKLRCPHCEFSTWARYDTRPAPSVWRHLDFGAATVTLRADLRRLACPEHGVKVEWVPWSRYRAGFTADFEDVAAFPATKTDKTAIARFPRIDWDTVGRICERVAATELDGDRLNGLVTIGVDEVSWKKHHNYLTLVSDHDSGKIVWGAPGKDAETLNGFFAELGEDRASELGAVSMDMGPAFNKSVTDKAPRATIRIDPFHVVKLVTDAFDTVRRIEWQALRAIDAGMAKLFKGARWALLENPENLDEGQAATLRKFKRRGGRIWAAYKLKGALRAIFHGDLTAVEAVDLIERWCRQADAADMPAFAKAAKTLRKHIAGITQALERKISNGRHEGINSNVRLIIRGARGFHSAEAALGLVILTCGPISLLLPHEKRAR